MLWNWQQKNWPNFSYNSAALGNLESEFLHKSGITKGSYLHVNRSDKNDLMVELISEEALKTSEIEGEYLNRDSVQSSIRRNFGLSTDNHKVGTAEQGIAEMMVDLYRNYAKPLTHEILFNWHNLLMNGRNDLKDTGMYRSHSEPMQVISGPLHNPKIHFEAPPSTHIKKEMDSFICWFNQTSPQGTSSIPALTRAGIAHLYFVSIHPFEDGNGRIGRALTEMALSQSIGQPVLIALSLIIQNKKKLYYDMLAASNKEMEITNWLLYFGRTILEAQNTTQKKIEFLINKTKFYDKVKGQLNERQEKVIARIFQKGLSGFEGGLSAENYISITGSSRATATRDLQDLVGKSFLIRTGELKSSRYYLNIPETSHFIMKRSLELLAKYKH